MLVANSAAGSRKQVRVRLVALPAEHGGWSLLLEPVVLGLLLAPSVGGLLLSLAAVAAFLTRHPLKLVINEYRRGLRSSRTTLAQRFVLYYATLSLIAFGAAVDFSDPEFLVPLMLAAPLALLQLVYDGMGRSRSLAGELTGSVAMASVASSIVLAAGWPYRPAFGVWAILVARVVPTILYVRCRLRVLNGKPTSRVPALTSHALAVAFVPLLALANFVPLLTVLPLLVLLIRAIVGLTQEGRSFSAKKLGMQEIGFGAFTILSVYVAFVFS